MRILPTKSLKNDKLERPVKIRGDRGPKLIPANTIAALNAETIKLKVEPHTRTIDLVNFGDNPSDGIALQSTLICPPNTQMLSIQLMLDVAKNNED